MHLRSISLLTLVLAFALFGCSTTDSRINEHAAVFNSLSPDAQAKIKSGQVEIGFTQEMTEMALGEPDRRYTRTTDKGTHEVWAYRSKAPSFSFGVGVGSSSGRTATGLGIGVGTGDRSDDRLRLVFEGGKITAIERAK
jgi:hypothetical protein